MADLLESLVKKARKRADQVEIYHMSRLETPVGFEANRLKQMQTRESEHFSMRIIKDGKVGGAATNNKKLLGELLDQALEATQFGVPAKFSLPPATKYPEIPVYDEQVQKVRIEHMTQLGQSLVDGVRREYPEVLCDAHVSRSTGEVRLVNSEGGSASYRRSAFALGVEGTWIRGTDMLFVGEHQVSSRPIVEGLPIVKEVLEQLHYARETVPAPTGTLPVVFTPRGFASAMLTALTYGFNGRFVVQGASPLTHRLGEKAFDARLSIFDDPTIPYCPGSRICDDEGMPSQRTPLVVQGVVQSFLYDLHTASQAKAKSTASANRFMGSMPMPWTSVIAIEAGTVAYQDLIANIKDGLIVDELLGAGQSNIIGGDFSANVLLGYKIEKGKIVGRVKDTMIAGNVYEALKDIVAVTKEARWVYGSLYTPPICCRVAVSAKG